jgi:hypothetical protein
MPKASLTSRKLRQTTTLEVSEKSLSDSVLRFFRLAVIDPKPICWKLTKTINPFHQRSL